MKENAKNNHHPRTRCHKILRESVLLELQKPGHSFVIHSTKFPYNEKQKDLLSAHTRMQWFDEEVKGVPMFEGKLQTSKWANITKTSTDTAFVILDPLNPQNSSNL